MSLPSNKTAGKLVPPAKKMGWLDAIERFLLRRSGFV
ncbi:hypothetical protein B0G84_7777 [Paraburkholderia sp. BL8N3]|nr:hypothetical protein B0G84_7777 [Paraburkholderia sp. BL8N3]